MRTDAALPLASLGVATPWGLLACCWRPLAAGWRGGVSRNYSGAADPVRLGGQPTGPQVAALGSTGRGGRREY